MLPDPAGYADYVAALRSAAANEPGPGVRTLGRVRGQVEHAAMLRYIHCCTFQLSSVGSVRVPATGARGMGW